MKSTNNMTSENRELYSYEYESQAEDILSFDPTDILNILNRKDIFNYITEENKEVIFHELEVHLLDAWSDPEYLCSIHNYLFADFYKGEGAAVFSKNALYDYFTTIIQNGELTLGKEIFDLLGQCNFTANRYSIQDAELFVISYEDSVSYFSSFYEYFCNTIHDIAREVILTAEQEDMTIQEFIDHAILEGPGVIEYLPFF